jgi:hypothetical protein
VDPVILSLGVRMVQHRKLSGLDAFRIDMEETWEIRWWCERLGCTEEQLAKAVAEVGILAKDVRDFLQAMDDRTVDELLRLLGVKDGEKVRIKAQGSSGRWWASSPSAAIGVSTEEARELIQRGAQMFRPSEPN